MKYDPVKNGARCDLCPLRGKTAVPPAPATGRLRLVIVGEGPGKHEEKAGLPFVGASGRLLDGTLRENGIRNRNEMHITNAALCRGESEKDNEKAALCCAPRLLNELAGIYRDVGRSDDAASAGAIRADHPPVVALGKAATFSVLGTKKIMYARGFVWKAAEIDPAVIRAAARKAEKPGAKQEAAVLAAAHLEGRAPLAGLTVFPVLHPAFILRAETWTPVWRIDMRRALRWAFEGPSSLEDQGALRVGGPSVLEGLGDVVSLDIETDGVKPLECKMLCVGVAHVLPDGKTAPAAVIYPWKREYAKPLREWLRTRKAVVAHNGRGFDEIVLAQHNVK